MYPSSTDSIVAFARGPKGDTGEVSAADLASAIAALKNGVDPAGDTLAELYALILARAPLGSTAAFSVSPTVPNLANGNNSTKAANSAFVQQELINYAVAITGSTMTGPLVLSGDPVTALGAVTKQYADALIAANDAMVFKGVIDCSTNPNYPAADRGWTYKVSVAGKIGGASGVNVEVGDILICITDGTASGTQAAVGAQWSIIQANIDGAVVGPASSTDGHIARFNGATGKLLKDVGGAVAVAEGGTGVTSASGTALDNITGFASTGLLARTGAGAFAFRALTAPAAGISVSNGDGVAGAPTLALANDLAALEALSTTGFAKRTGTDTWSLQSQVAIGSDVSGLGTGIATFLATPNSANLAAAVTDETGGTSGAVLVFNKTPTFAGNVTLSAGSVLLDANQALRIGGIAILSSDGSTFINFGSVLATLNMGFYVNTSGNPSMSVFGASGSVAIGSSTDPGGTGNLKIAGAFSSKAQTTLTGTSGTAGADDSAIVVNSSGTFTLTLPAATGVNSGREMMVKTIAANAVNSASSNVVPLVGGAAGTAILAATAGKFARLKSNGTAWEIMVAN